MPRRHKHRNCRRLNGSLNLKPAGIPAMQLEETILFLDEFEAIRLCDYDGMNQIQAAEAMEVSRATVQRLLLSGRRKIVDALLHKKGLVVEEKLN